MFFDVFCKKIPAKTFTDIEGNVQVQHLFLFDENFKPITDFLQAHVFGHLNLARSYGDDRQAILEVQQQLLKKLQKSKDEDRKKWGV
jgi:hypothetical protein